MKLPKMEIFKNDKMPIRGENILFFINGDYRISDLMVRLLMFERIGVILGFIGIMRFLMVWATYGILKPIYYTGLDLHHADDLRRKLKLEVKLI